jgi:hypothetical protein
MTLVLIGFGHGFQVKIVEFVVGPTLPVPFADLMEAVSNLE